MILVPYRTTVPIDPTTPGQKVALVHPGGTQPGSLYVRGFDVLSTRVGTVALLLSRYSTAATNGTTQTSASFLDGAPPSFAEVRYGNVAWPTGLIDTEKAFAEPRGMGGNIVIPTGNVAAGALTIAPGHSLVIETINADMRENSTFDLRIFWGEHRPALPHIASSTLPASSAYTTATYFNVPPGWTSITFEVTYTAHASSMGGRPAWRGSVSDGTNDYPLTVTDTTIDGSGQRLVYPMSDRWHATVVATETICFTVSFDIPPGMPKVRLDLAEIGDTTNRGTASVLVTGQ